MSKGLEAFKDFCDSVNACINSGGITNVDLKAEKQVIKELKDKEKYEGFVQEICNYLGLDNLFPYNDLEEIEKQIKTIADNSHWIAVKQDQKKLKALDIIKVLFKGRARLYERNDGVEQIIDKNGNYHKVNCVVYILEFHVENQHHEFYLHREEYDLLKEIFKS